MGRKTHWLWSGLALCLLATPLAADERDYFYVPRIPTDSRMIVGPKCLAMQDLVGFAQCEPSSHQDFISSLRHWRFERKIYVGYDGARYDAPGQRWTQSSFIQPTMMVEDRTFYDLAAGRYTVDRYLDDLEKRYGGIDNVVIWPSYPNLGIDNRNQLDMILAMPGGVVGVRQVVADFHHRGVKVYFPINMWDEGTRDPGQPWPDAVADLMKQLDADGVFGDTQDGVPLAFPAAAEKAGHALAFQTELWPSDEDVAWNLSSWWQEAPSVYQQFVPPIDRYKWIEPRHIPVIATRWSRDKTDAFQVAYFNGIGIESWENIFGFWNGLTARDGEALRRVATLERGVAPFLVSQDWEPLYPMRNFGVFSSRWPLGDQTVWTVVNRNEYAVEGRQMSVPFKAGERYFDLYRGEEIKSERDGAVVNLSFPLEDHGYGAILGTSSPDAAMTALMAKMKTLSAKPLAQFSQAWSPLPQHQTAIPATKPAKSAPQDMVAISSGAFDFRVQGIEVEGSDQDGVDIAYPWENSPRRFHRHQMTIHPFFIDKHNVTNAEFKAFLDASHYQPKDPANFLKDWRNGTYPDGWGDKPVTWVSLEDARAYAAWAGKRLPHEWEWQYAAQGPDGRAYPWGVEWKDDAVPKPNTARSLRGPDGTLAHPSGASPFGVMDLVGNVWQWTDEYMDDHTRSGILRGGSYYQPQGSLWYFPSAYRNDQHGKYLLMAPSKDRAATVGFRCVVDAE